jgi:hypothetical protein
VALSAAPKSLTALPRNSLSFDSLMAMVYLLEFDASMFELSMTDTKITAARVTAMSLA